MTVNPELERLWLMVDHRRYSEAESLARDVLAAEPSNGTALRYLSNSLAGLRRMNEALEAAQHACRAQPDDPWNFIQLSRLCASLCDGPGAVEAARHAIALSPQRVEAHDALASAYLTRTSQWNLDSAHDASGALVAADDALRLNPTSVSGRINRGRALYQLGRNKEAVREYHLALELRPDATVALNNIGWIYMKSRPIYATRCFAAALARDPQGSTAQLNLEGVIAMWMYRMIWILLWGGTALVAARCLTAKPVPALLLALLGVTCAAGSVMFYQALPRRSLMVLWRRRPVRCFSTTIRFATLSALDVVITCVSGSLWLGAVVVLAVLLVAEWKVNFSALERRFIAWRARGQR